MKKPALTLLILMTFSGLLFAQSKQKSSTEKNSVPSVKSTDVSTPQLNPIDVSELVSQAALKEDVGYGYEKPSNVLSSINTLHISNSQADGYNNMYEYLRGRVPGLDVTDYGGSYQIHVRGINSLQNGGGEPLIVVNGMPGSLMTLDSIDPQDVKSVSVLKDGSSTAMYGTRGAAGVILIQTR